MRASWACPDLGLAKEPGYYLPVDGTSYEFPECPQFWLRTAGMRLDAPHLIDGTIHPASLVSRRAAELENGAIRADDIAPRVRELIHIWLPEREAAREHERERTREEGKRRG